MYRSFLGASIPTFPSRGGESNPGEAHWDSRISVGPLVCAQAELLSTILKRGVAPGQAALLFGLLSA
jgi:hypothetical protein